MVPPDVPKGHKCYNVCRVMIVDLYWHIQEVRSLARVARKNQELGGGGG